MDCRNTASARAHRASQLLVRIFMWLAILVALLHALVASAEPPRMKPDAVLARAMDYQLRFREGDMTVVPQYIALVEAATQADPGNADLWYTKGRANLLQGAAAMLSGGNAAEGMAAMQKGLLALDRALQINPDHPEALAQRGAVRALRASMFNAPALAASSVAEMNRAAELAPDSLMVRLVRGFLGPTLPDDLRNRQLEGEDLDFIIDAAQWNRAGDYATLLRADLHFETGRPDLARGLYEIVEHSTSPASAVARTRLAALEKGGVAMAEIKALRSAAGAQCALCHARQ